MRKFKEDFIETPPWPLIRYEVSFSTTALSADTGVLILTITPVISERNQAMVRDATGPHFLKIPKRLPILGRNRNSPENNNGTLANYRSQIPISSLHEKYIENALWKTQSDKIRYLARGWPIENSRVIVSFMEEIALIFNNFGIIGISGSLLLGCHKKKHAIARVPQNSTSTTLSRRRSIFQPTSKIDVRFDSIDSNYSYVLIFIRKLFLCNIQRI